MKKNFKSLIAVALMATSVATIAQPAYDNERESNYDSSNPYAQSGFYLEGNAGINIATIDYLGFQGSAAHGFAWSVNSGYKFNRYIGLEAGFTQYRVGADEDSGDNINSVDVALKGFLPLTDRFSIFAKAGGTTLFSSGESSNVQPYLGIGAAYAITPNLAFNVQVSGLTLGWVNLGALTGGLTYYFN